MKGIRATRFSALSVAIPALAGLAAACALSDSQRELAHADAEIFETIVRSQLTDSTARSFGFLRVDPRATTDNAPLAGAAQPSRPLDLQSSDSLTDELVGRVQVKRTSILRSLRVPAGGPFSYPYCGGARRSIDSPSTADYSQCPRDPVRYVTVGLPYRGAAPVLERLRRPETPAPDSASELWTALVTETNVGPGGQQWRQYAWLFRRDLATGSLAVVERFLLSWAE